ncbi:DUF2249 domain-containing protein [Blastococcus saxobsidens]|nr:DUF2249 domain-containing protein [Blastococcus saxobsidens]
MPDSDILLDVREEAPARRHELIFGAYDDLPPGNGFVLVNDHDPKPLYYQWRRSTPGSSSGTIWRTGPKVWRVRIGRTAAPVSSKRADEPPR